MALVPAATPAEKHNRTSPSFLLLSRRVRSRIYGFLGTLGCPYDARFINLANEGAPRSEHDRLSFIQMLSLLLTCRTINDEVGHLAYSTNHFFERMNSLSKLSALPRLRPNSLQALTLLTIHLNVASCGLGIPCNDALYPKDCEGSIMQDYDKLDSPLALSQSGAKATIDHWHMLWNNILRPNLKESGRLTLNFVCDVADLETGVQITRPFLSEPRPLLAGCSIRLSRKPDRDLQKLAQSVVSFLTTYNRHNAHHSNDHNSFHFLDLPLELRHKILSNTDLITPYREVEWNPSHGFYWRYKYTACWGNAHPGKLHGRRVGHRSRLNAFHGGNDSADPNDTRPYRSCWEDFSFSGCFCRASHAAHSTVFSCTCWGEPTSLFLVNREMRRDAMQVFYNMNKFIIAPVGGTTWRGVESAPDRLPVAAFLSMLPRDGLRFLRSLEVVFPPFGVDSPCLYCPTSSPQWQDWVQTIDLVKKHLDLPKLTLRVYFASWLPEAPGRIPAYREFMDEDSSSTIQKTYLDIIKPLQELKGLKCFYAHLTDPCDYGESEIRWLRELEDEAERFVMGDWYDAFAAGKGEKKESRWIEDDLEHGLWGAEP